MADQTPNINLLRELRELANQVIGPDDALEPMAAYYHDPEAFRQDWSEKVTPIVLLRLLDIAEAAYWVTAADDGCVDSGNRSLRLYELAKQIRSRFAALTLTAGSDA